MARKRITMQQLADACGLSRNTVSKVFNDRGSVPEATRQAVLQKARELGYYQPFEEAPAAVEPPRFQNIALLTRHPPTEAHFGTFFLPAFIDRLSRAGYMLTMYEVTPEQMAARVLPPHVPLDQLAGLSVIELFDQGYLEMLCSLGLPCISVDCSAETYLAPMRCDVVCMENTAGTAAVVRHLLDAGARRLGFVGDPEHCSSFRLRHLAFSMILKQAGLPVDPALSILDEDAPDYSDVDWLYEKLRQMPAVPDALVCANDFLALSVMQALKRLGLSIPEDVMVTGFDGTPQSAVVEPTLTTVQIPNPEIGYVAADILLARIREPGHPFRVTYVETTPVWRGSTARKPT